MPAPPPESDPAMVSTLGGTTCLPLAAAGAALGGLATIFPDLPEPVGLLGEASEEGAAAFSLGLAEARGLPSPLALCPLPLA
jgi:hypothetical protein